MRPTLLPLFALIFPALFLIGCPNFGSSTGLASGDAASLVADRGIDTLSGPVAPASDTGNPEASSGPAVSDAAVPSTDSAPAVGAVDAPGADSGKPASVANPDSVKPVAAASGTDAATPDTFDASPDTSRPVAAVQAADSAKPVDSAKAEDAAKSIVAAPTPDIAVPLHKPLVEDLAPVIPAAVIPAAVAPAAPAAEPALASGVFLNSDFESESLECWNGNRTATSSNGAGCGPFKSIGFTPFALAQNGITHSGTKAIDITYAKNEEMGGTNVGISADSVNVRAWYYFEPGFDFGQGMKIGRVSSFNNAKQLNDVDIILEVRSSGGKNQCGVTDMADVGLFFNGAPKGYDWGNAAANISFQRGRWYAVEYQVVLNTPGRADGAVRLWVDGQRVAARTGLNIRGTAGMDAKLNTVKIGGWYSNGANGNSCVHPAQPSKLHMDDVAIATSYIGLGAPNSVAAR